MLVICRFDIHVIVLQHINLQAMKSNIAIAGQAALTREVSRTTHLIKEV